MHHIVRRLGATAVLLAAIVATGATAASAADRTVDMVDLDFEPGSVTIAPGDTVTWRNQGAAPHDATGDGWSTPLLTAGQSASVTFETAGTYNYICTIHPDMTGRVVVRAASTGGGGPAVTDPPTDTVPLAPTTPGTPNTIVPIAILASAVAAFLFAARRFVSTS